jgi:putative toxin-antitoxin system antitoxin component (TIGR02293 family)
MNDDEPLPPDGLRLRELVRLARETFETAVEARAWLKRPHPMLGGASPLERAKTGLGAQRVKDILVVIKHGGVV